MFDAGDTDKRTALEYYSDLYVQGVAEKMKLSTELQLLLKISFEAGYNTALGVKRQA